MEKLFSILFHFIKNNWTIKYYVIISPQIIGPAKHPPSKIDSNITQKAQSNSDSSSESDEEMGPVPQMNASGDFNPIFF